MADDPTHDYPGCLGCLSMLAQLLVGIAAAAVLIFAAVGGISYTLESQELHERLERLEAEVKQLRKELAHVQPTP